MKIGIIIGSIREGRAGETIGQWVKDSADRRDTAGVEYELIDLKGFNVPLVTTAVVPAAANKQYDDENVAAWSRAIDSCDGFIFVTPEYNHSVPGPFKNAFDSLGSEWSGKPVGFVGYGANDGVRAVEAWRLAVSNFDMIDVRDQVALSLFSDFDDSGFAPLERRGAELDAVLGAVEAWGARLGK